MCVHGNVHACKPQSHPEQGMNRPSPLHTKGKQGSGPCDRILLFTTPVTLREDFVRIRGQTVNTCDSSLDDGTVLKLYLHRFVGELHEESADQQHTSSRMYSILQHLESSENH